MKKIIIILSLIFIVQTSFASGGSVYTRFGLGDIIYNSTARRLGLGNLGIAIIDKDYISNVNPASWSGINLTRMEASVAFVGNNISDANNSVLRRSTYFNGISFALPIQRDYGIAVAFGVLPYSKVDYELRQSFQSNLVDDYEEELKGNGGVSKFFIGTSYVLPYGFSAGATMEYYFGKIEYHSNLIFPDTSTFRNVGYIEKNNYYGFGFTFGLISPDVSKIFSTKKIEDFRIGFLFSPKEKINTDTTISTNNLIGGSQIANGLTTSEIPMKLGLGLSFVAMNNFKVAFDYLGQDWTNSKISGRTGQNLTSSYLLSLGVEYFKKTTQFSGFWEQVRYRFGLSYQKTPLKVLGEDIFQYAVSAGISFPLGAFNSIDLGVTTGMRGKKEGKLLEEKFVEGRISLSFGERWFIRRNR